jgi:hypothetical protein
MMVCYVRLAECYFIDGDSELGIRVAMDAAAIASEQRYEWGDAVAQRLIGVGHLLQGNMPAARAALSASVHDLEKIGEPFELANACRAMAELGRRINDSYLTEHYGARATSLLQGLGASKRQLLLDH